MQFERPSHLLVHIGEAKHLQGAVSQFHPYNCRKLPALRRETLNLRTNMALYALDDNAPQVAPSAWVADSAQVMGAVVLHDDASVWFGTVVRGDTESITIGAGSNVQDASVLHADFGQPLVIGERVTVGHKVMLHGCTIGDESLIGIGAVVLNGAKIGKNCLVGAGALVTEGKEFPDGSMIIGSPARVVRQLTPEQMNGLRASAQHYVENARRFRGGLRRIDQE